MQMASIKHTVVENGLASKDLGAHHTATVGKPVEDPEDSVKARSSTHACAQGALGLATSRFRAFALAASM